MALTLCHLSQPLFWNCSKDEGIREYKRPSLAFWQCEHLPLHGTFSVLKSTYCVFPSLWAPSFGQPLFIATLPSLTLKHNSTTGLSSTLLFYFIILMFPFCILSAAQTHPYFSTISPTSNWISPTRLPSFLKSAFLKWNQSYFYPNNVWFWISQSVNSSFFSFDLRLPKVYWPTHFPNPNIT